MSWFIFAGVIFQNRVKYTQKTEAVDNSEGKYKQMADKDGKFIPEKLHISAWNVNGIRAVLRKETIQHYVQEYQPDILCLRYVSHIILK